MERLAANGDKPFKIAALVVFLLTTGLTVLLIYDAFVIRKSGEFCEVLGKNDPYDFEFPEGKKCKLNPDFYVEPLGIFLIMQAVTQLPFWCIFWFSKSRVSKENTKRTIRIKM